MFLFRQLPRVCINVKYCSSALYITGDKASANFTALTPYIDFKERLQNRALLEENIKLRQHRINLDKCEKYWNFYSRLVEKLYLLEADKQYIHENLKELMKDPDKNIDEIEKLKLHAKAARDNYKSLRDYTYPVEECAALNALSIPNVLDDRTPRTGETVLHTFMDKPSRKAKSHFEIAANLNLIYYVNPTFFFLQGDAAMFELSLTNYAHDTLLSNSFIPTVNSSFSRSVIAEGCCVEYINPKNIYTIYEEDSLYSVSKLHFVGNSSLYSFMAYFAKFSIQDGYFPIKFFTIGKQYNPGNSDEKSLLNLHQYSTVDIFLVSKDNEETYAQIFEDLIGITKQLYDSLGYHYRLIFLPANKLKDYESLRLSIQMYSSHIQEYVEVGNVSLCSNYLSKRLLVTYNENKIRKYANIISGTLINVQKMLACVLEYNDLCGKELLSAPLDNYYSAKKM